MVPDADGAEFAADDAVVDVSRDDNVIEPMAGLSEREQLARFFNV